MSEDAHQMKLLHDWWDDVMWDHQSWPVHDDKILCKEIAGVIIDEYTEAASCDSIGSSAMGDDQGSESE